MQGDIFVFLIILHLLKKYLKKFNKLKEKNINNKILIIFLNERLKIKNLLKNYLLKKIPNNYNKAFILNKMNNSFINEIFYDRKYGRKF